MDRRLRPTFLRAVLQWLLEASAEVLITTYMMTSSSSAYGIRQQFPRQRRRQQQQQDFLHPRQAQ
jgi:hypothetical protein